MVNFDTMEKPQSAVTAPLGYTDSAWRHTSARFLDAVSARQRDQVAKLLSQPNNGGSGLREWVSAIASRGATLPKVVPEAVIDVYLNDPEAVPLYDCESCGLAIPVRPSRIYGLDGDPDEVYFTSCPACGARTGLFMHFTRRYETSVTESLRRRPR
jgi:hypothetical protein